ncbi:hypothetical protein Tco_0364478 [Tanacetum coccineum]
MPGLSPNGAFNDFAESMEWTSNSVSFDIAITDSQRGLGLVSDVSGCLLEAKEHGGKDLPVRCLLCVKNGRDENEGTAKVFEGTEEVQESTAQVHEGTAQVNEGTAQVNEGTAEEVVQSSAEVLQILLEKLHPVDIEFCPRICGVEVVRNIGSLIIRIWIRVIDGLISETHIGTMPTISTVKRTSTPRAPRKPNKFEEYTDKRVDK